MIWLALCVVEHDAIVDGHRLRDGDVLIGYLLWPPC